MNNNTKTAACLLTGLFISCADKEVKQDTRNRVEKLAVSFWYKFDDASGTYLVKDDREKKYYAIVASDSQNRHNGKDKGNDYFIHELDSTRIDSTIKTYMEDYKKLSGTDENGFVIRKTNLQETTQFGHKAVITDFGYVFLYTDKNKVMQNLGSGTIFRLQDVKVLEETNNDVGVFMTGDDFPTPPPPAKN